MLAASLFTIFMLIGWLLRNELSYIAALLWLGVTMYLIVDALLFEFSFIGDVDKLLIMTVPVIFSVLALLSLRLNLRSQLRQLHKTYYLLFKQ